MNRSTLFNLHALARRLGVSAAWLKAEAKAGRIPCLRVGRRLLFNGAAVEGALAARAAEGHPTREAVRHGQ